MAKIKETTKKTVAKKPVTAEKKKPATEKKSPEGKAKPDDANKKRDTMTTDEVAKYLGVTTARVSQLKRDGIIAPLPSGSKKEGDFYKPLETFIKAARHYRELSDSRGSRDSEEMKKAKERQFIARAKKEELDLSEREGELHRADDIIHAVGSALSRLRINLLAIPKGIAPQIIDEKNINVIAEKINDRICRALNEVVTLDINKLLKEEEE